MSSLPKGSPHSDCLLTNYISDAQNYEWKGRASKALINVAMEMTSIRTWMQPRCRQSRRQPWETHSHQTSGPSGPSPSVCISARKEALEKIPRFCEISTVSFLQGSSCSFKELQYTIIEEPKPWPACSASPWAASAQEHLRQLLPRLTWPCSATLGGVHWSTGVLMPEGCREVFAK